MRDFNRSLPLLLSTLLISACTAHNTLGPLPNESCTQRLSGQAIVIGTTVQAADGREMPVELFLPPLAGEYPLIGFSHGAFAAPDRYRKMLEPIAAAGFVIIAPMHLDSEEFEHDTPPSQLDVWRTRVEDFELALDPSRSALGDLILSRGYAWKGENVIAMGHSSGALIAQIAGGAVAKMPDGELAEIDAAQPVATIAWSPPGTIPGTIEADGWVGMEGHALILTGTADVLTQMQTDWRWHLEGYASIPPETQKVLFVGDGIDHYFGGSFGRERERDPAAKLLFERALAQTVHFLDVATKREAACDPGRPVAGEHISRD